MVYERIKALREANCLTQAELAKQLGITRAAVNAWEMGISVPSPNYLVELSRRFGVSVDYLLGLERNACIDVSGLDDADIAIIYQLVQHLAHRNGTWPHQAT